MPPIGPAQALQTIDMPIIQLQPNRQFLSPTQPDRPTLNVHQQPRTVQQRQPGNILEAPIGNQQQALLLSRIAFTPRRQPITRLAQRRHHALTDAKGLLAQLFDDAYRQRARMALLTASGQSPKWQVQGLKAAKSLAGWLDQLGAGGGTPLLAALTEAGHWLVARRKRYPAEQQRLLVITDGRLKDIAGLPLLECPGLLMDIERGPIRLGRAQELAVGLQLDYRHIDSV